MMKNIIIVPILKNAALTMINGEGELFASKICLGFVHKVAKLYPDLKFKIQTNGQSCNKKNL